MGYTAGRHEPVSEPGVCNAFVSMIHYRQQCIHAMRGAVKVTGVRFFNTLTRNKEDFVPQRPGRVGMYTCGPTVYEYASIGNMRAYVFADILRRTLEFNGLGVNMVMNITDVGHLVSDADEGEDKMLISARREGKTPWDIARYYATVFLNDACRLNIKPATVLCYATEHIPEMIAMVQELVDRGYAYETSDGVYFDISKFPEYGCLSRINLSEQKAGARVEVNPEKRNPADFALWKKAPAEHIMQWGSPWGMGYPGWHIECSAMGRKYLGDQFDIHTGGIDHIPVHHENEIAQTAACTGQPAARFWMHVEFLLVDGGKMSKSLGNVYTVNDLEARGIEPLAFRYLCLGAHYRAKLNFTWDAVTGAQKGLLALRRAVQRVARGDQPADARGGILSQKALRFKEGFLRAINDDLNTPQALAVLWEATRAGLGPELLDVAGACDRVFALDLLKGRLGPDEDLAADDLPDDVRSLLEERHQARLAKHWNRADAIRDELARLGYGVKDTPRGYQITRIVPPDSL